MARRIDRSASKATNVSPSSSRTSTRLRPANRCDGMDGQDHLLLAPGDHRQLGPLPRVGDQAQLGLAR